MGSHFLLAMERTSGSMDIRADRISKGMIPEWKELSRGGSGGERQKGASFLSELTDIFRFEVDFPNGPHELLSMSSRAIPGALFQASMKQPWQKWT